MQAAICGKANVRPELWRLWRIWANYDEEWQAKTRNDDEFGGMTRNDEKYDEYDESSLPMTSIIDEAMFERLPMPPFICLISRAAGFRQVGDAFLRAACTVKLERSPVRLVIIWQLISCWCGKEGDIRCFRLPSLDMMRKVNEMVAYAILSNSWAESLLNCYRFRSLSDTGWSGWLFGSRSYRNLARCNL